MKNEQQHFLTRNKFAGHSILIGLILVLGAAISLRAGDVVSLLASATSSLSGDPAILFFAPYATDTLRVGDIATIDVSVNARVPVNAIGATIKFPSDTLEVVGISKEKSFLDLWTEETSIREHDGEVHFSGGTLRKGGLTGVGVLLTLTVRAKKVGAAQLSFANSQVLAHNGTGSPVETEARTYTYDVTENSPPAEVFIDANKLQRREPSADFDNSGTITLADMSNLTFHLLSGYDARFDLNEDGRLNLADLSIFFSQVQKSKRP